MIFYNKYKKFRIENNIDLKDISKRTKIDLKYLQALERGKFAEIPPVYVKLFFKAYINEIGIDVNEALSELDSFLNQKSNNNSLKFIPDEQNESSNFFSKVNSENLFNSSVFIGIASFFLILLLSFSLNSNSEISQKDLEDELRITKSDLIEFYSLRSEEVLSIESITNPITIRFKSNIENYIHFYDNFSGKEFFIFEDSLSSQSNTFTEQWGGEEKSLLIANTVDYELILFSENSYQDFSKNIINDFPVEVILSSNPYSITIKKYLQKN
jgi:cytoskeletal protein RodZ